MGLRDRLRRLRRASEQEQIVVTLKDGTTSRFSKEEVFSEALRHESKRWRAGYRGATVPPPHPVVEALRQAPESEIQRLFSLQGHLIAQMAGEDLVLRGEVKRGHVRN